MKPIHLVVKLSPEGKKKMPKLQTHSEVSLSSQGPGQCWKVPDQGTNLQLPSSCVWSGHWELEGEKIFSA